MFMLNFFFNLRAIYMIYRREILTVKTPKISCTLKKHQKKELTENNEVKVKNNQEFIQSHTQFKIGINAILTWEQRSRKNPCCVCWKKVRHHDFQMAFSHLSQRNVKLVFKKIKESLLPSSLHLLTFCFS